jgi:hypothetical protein
MTDSFAIYEDNSIETYRVRDGFLKIKNNIADEYRNVWLDTQDLPIPIIQYQVLEADTVSIEITAIDDPGYDIGLTMEVFVNDVKQTRNVDFTIVIDQSRAYVTARALFYQNDRVLIKVFSQQPPNELGKYETPTSLTNNPLNGPISDFTFSELGDHVKTITANHPKFNGIFPGSNNLRDLDNTSSYGSRLVSHQTPLSFCQFFLGSAEHSLITATRKVCLDYNQFKFNLIKNISELQTRSLVRDDLNTVLAGMNIGKEGSAVYA